MTTNTQQKFLPIDTAEGFFLDPKKAREFGEERSAGYRSADPYPHIVMDDFLPVDLAENILRHFPAASAERHAAEHALNYPGIQKTNGRFTRMIAMRFAGICSAFLMPLLFWNCWKA